MSSDSILAMMGLRRVRHRRLRRRLLGWRCGPSMTTQLVLDALEQAVWTRQRAGLFRKTSGHEFERYDAPLARTTATVQCAC
jgi:transposase InsO family protein